MNAGASEAPLCCWDGAYKAGANPAQQVCADENLGEVPVNPKPRIPDDVDEFSIGLGRYARTKLIRPCNRTVNLVEPLSLAADSARLNLHRQPRNQSGHRTIIFGSNQQSHSTASVQGLFA